MSSRRDSVGRVAAATAVLYCLFVAARLLAYGGDPSAFMVAGDGITQVAEAPSNLGVNTGIDGYDGQAYYRLSRDPLTNDVDDLGIAFTRPAYWQSRIGYPAVVWTLSLGGRESLVPSVMVIVNGLALIALGAGAAMLARSYGRSTWLGLLPALWGGYVVGLAEDLTEPLAGALLVLAVLALRHNRAGWAVVALTAAALTRETSLILAAGILGAAVLRRPSPPWWVGAVPFVPYVAWRTWVHQRWDDKVPDPSADNPLTTPVVELVRYLGRAVQDLPAHGENLVLLVPSLVAVAILASVLVGSPSRGDLHLRLALAAYLLLLVCLPVWDRGQAYLRWCCEPVLVGWVLVLDRPLWRQRLRVLSGAVAVLWVATALTTYRYPDPQQWVAPDVRSSIP